MNNNFDIEVLKVLRAGKSKSWLSKRLGYDHNQVYLWESRKRKFYWKDFENLCVSLNRPYYKCLKKHFKFFFTEELCNITYLLKTSLAAYDNREIAKIFGISQSKLSRWISGASSIPFNNACDLLIFTQNQFYEFMDDLIGPRKLASIQKIVLQKKAAKKGIYTYPYISALAPALCLKKYKSLKKHQHGVLAKLIGISMTEEVKGLKLLCDLGQIYKKNGIYELKPYKVDTSSDDEGFFKNFQYWSEFAAQFQKRADMKSRFVYRIFSTSSKNYLKIKKVQRKYFEDISKILKDEKIDQHDHLVVMLLQTMLLEEKRSNQKKH